VGDLTEKASAVICLRLPSDREAATVLRALKPETESSVTYRSEVQVTKEGRRLTLVFESTDTTALRASAKSYLSWLQLLTNVFETLEPQRS